MESQDITAAVRQQLLLAARRHQTLQPQIHRQRRILFIVMRNRSPHQSRARPLRSAPAANISVKFASVVAANALSHSANEAFNPARIVILVRRVRRHLHHIRRSRMIRGPAASRLRLGHVIHHPRKRPHLRRRLVLVIRPPASSPPPSECCSSARISHAAPQPPAQSPRRSSSRQAPAQTPSPETVNTAAALIKDTRRIALSLKIDSRTSPPAYPAPAPATSLFAALYPSNLQPSNSSSPKPSSPDDEQAAP